MIQILSDIMRDDECSEFIDFYYANIDKKININSDNVYHFDGVNLMDNINDFKFLKRIGLLKIDIDRIRVQHVNKDTNILEKFHQDKEPYTFIIFLNENFDGGELIYENITVKPKKKQLLYTTGNEWHYVKKVNSG